MNNTFQVEFEWHGGGSIRQADMETAKAAAKLMAAKNPSQPVCATERLAVDGSRYAPLVREYIYKLPSHDGKTWINFDAPVDSLLDLVQEEYREGAN